MTEPAKSRNRADLHEQRIESLGALAGGLAHNVNNLMTPIQLACDTLDGCVDGSEAAREALELVRAGASRAAELCTGLLGHLRGLPREREPIDLPGLVAETMALLRGTMPPTISVVTSLAPSFRVLGDPAELQQVVVNLCVNARDAMPDGGELVVGVELVAADTAPPIASPAHDLGDEAGHHVARVRVADTGEGIDEESMRQLWDPFFSTKEVGAGTGLGLPSALAIVRSHGGTIQVASTVGVGSRFDVYLPVVLAEPEVPATEPPPPASRRGSHVLVIDDEPTVLRALCRSLERAGHRVSEAARADEGLAALGADPTIDVVVTDLTMPGTGGQMVLDRIAELRPGLPAVLISGVAPDEVVDRIAERPHSSFLAKPFDTDELLAALDRAIGSGAS